jgi:hypothetical protein
VGRIKVRSPPFSPAQGGAWGATLNLRLIPVNLDVFLHAAVGDGKHDPQAGRDGDAHARPKRADRRKNPGLPESRENAAHEDHVTQKVQASPFHEGISSVVFELLVLLAPPLVLAVIFLDFVFHLLDSYDTRGHPVRPGPTRALPGGTGNPAPPLPAVS